MTIVRTLAVAALLAVPARAAERTLTLDLGGGVGLDLVLVEAGSFEQGSPPGEPGRSDDEAARPVRITSDFYMGRYEVTRAQWGRFVEETRYRSEAEKGTSGGFGWDGRGLSQSPRFNWRSPGYAATDRQPVTIVTYDDALAFARWLSGRSGRPITLPTEAQWEYAARAGTATRFYGGDADAVAARVGWFKGNAPDGPREVGQKEPNGLGLYDMAGNVYEWCLDWYGPYGAEPATDPLAARPDASDKPRRVLRGGSWLKDARALRSAARYRNTPGSRNADNGFRVVASVGALPEAAAGEEGRLPSERPGDDDGRKALIGLALLLVPGGLCLGIPAVVVYLLVRRRRTARTRIDPDGFTLRVPGARAGQHVHYRYRVGRAVKTGSIPLTGDGSDGVFVYTGDRPSAVEFLAVTAAAEAASGALAPRERPDEPAPVRDEPDPFVGYPSAY